MKGYPEKVTSGVGLVLLTMFLFCRPLGCGPAAEWPSDASDDSGAFDASCDSGVSDAGDASGEFDASDASFVTDAADGSIVLTRADFIVFAKDPTQFDLYLLLANPSVSVAYRSPSPHPSDQDQFEAQGRSYYFTAASSDYPNYEKEPLYVNLATISTVAARPYCRGFYVHEVMTLLASKNNWDWQAALKEFNWAWMDQVVAYARQNGKRVIWSEPSYAWQTLDGSASAASHFASWGKILTPMFATNFPTQMADARKHAWNVSKRYGLVLGESHQAWYFRDQHIAVTRQGSLDLAKEEGWDYGARCFQFEGMDTDLLWESPYMQGVRLFSNFVDDHP